MKRLNIGFDVDDVLADFVSSFVSLCRRLYGKPAEGWQPPDWDWTKGGSGLTTEEVNGAWEELRRTRNFWAHLQRAAGADSNAMRKLVSHRLFFITARVPTEGHAEEDQTALFLRNEFDLYFPTVIVTADKGPIAAALQLDYYIDDRPKNCLEVRYTTFNSNTVCKVFLKDASHNQGVFMDGIRRVKDLNEFVSIIQKENNGSTNR